MAEVLRSINEDLDRVTQEHWASYVTTRRKFARGRLKKKKEIGPD
jgi:hypothetical protein